MIYVDAGGLFTGHVTAPASGDTRTYCNHQVSKGGKKRQALTFKLA